MSIFKLAKKSTQSFQWSKRRISIGLLIPENPPQLTVGTKRGAKESCTIRRTKECIDDLQSAIGESKYSRTARVVESPLEASGSTSQVDDDTELVSSIRAHLHTQFDVSSLKLSL